MNRRPTTPPGDAVKRASSPLARGRRLPTRMMVLFLPFMLACGESDAMMVGVADVPDALSITVDYLAPGTPLGSPEQVELEIGESVSLSATALNALGLALGEVAVSWSSSDVTVADVTAEGLVTALAAGVSEISASVDDVSSILQVVVNGTAAPPAPGS